MSLTIRVLLSITCLATTLASCGGAKFSGESRQASGGSADEPIDQPADVAGGLGLTCVPSTNAEDPSKTDFNCTYADSSGKQFKERADLKVDLQVKVGDQVIAVSVNTSDTGSSFSFTVEKTELEKVQVVAKLINPQDGNKVLKDNSAELKTILTNNWKDVTTEENGSSSSCEKKPGRCTKQDSSTGLWWSKARSSTQSWSAAKAYCRGLNHNGQTGWRLPRRVELVAVGSVGIKQAANDDWISSAKMNTAYWSSTSDVSDGDSESSATKAFIVAFAGAAASTPKIAEHSVVCVRALPATPIAFQDLWDDLSPGGSCSADSKKCVLKLKSSNLIVSGVQTGSDIRLWEYWEDAQSKCANLQILPDYPRGSWSLPTSSQLQQASANSVRSVRGWPGAADINVDFWSSNVDLSNSNAVNTASLLNASTGWSLKTNKLQFFCVKSDQQSMPSVQACLGSCYNEGSSPNYAQDLPIGTERLGPDGVTIALSYASGSSGFKIWKEKNGSRILNASGITTHGWQRKLTRAGTAYRDGVVLDSSLIEGRVCPDKVFKASSDQQQGGSSEILSGSSPCLYYTSILAFSKTLRGLSEGVKGEDYISEWTANKAVNGEPCVSSSNTPPPWYAGNIKTCADVGMRLPVLFEFKDWKSGCGEGSVVCSSSHLPGSVSESDTTGLPASNTWTATASSRCNGDSLFGRYFWVVYEETGQVRTASSARSDSSAHIRCVLPGL